MPKCVIKRDEKGRFAGCMPGTGGGSGSGSGGGKGGKKSGGGGLAGGLPNKVDDLQAIAKKEGIDIDTLSHKGRKSVLAAAINAKRAGKDLKDEGLLKPTKTKGRKPPSPVGSGKLKTIEDEEKIIKKYQSWEKHQETYADVGLFFASKQAAAKVQSDLKLAKGYAKKPSLTADEVIAANKRVARIADNLDKRNQDVKDLEAGFSPDVKKFLARPDAEQLRERSMSGQWVGAEASVSDSPKLGVTDSKGNLQAIASYNHSKESGFEVEYLATAPWNITQSDSRSIKGAGTQAIAAAVEKSKALGYDGAMSLSPLDSAVPFYKKLGFVQDPQTENMSLSPEAARSLLQKLKG